MKLLQYNKLLGSLEYDKEDKVYIGEILGIDAYCPFFGDTEEKAKEDFKKACIEYTEFCKESEESKTQIIEVS